MKNLRETFAWILKEEGEEGQQPFMISFKEANSLFSAFHLSEKLLSPTEFTFTPRVPRTPIKDRQENGWEDDFTPRVSLAPRVELALEAGAFGDYVYAGDVPEVESLADKVDSCPGGDWSSGRFSLGDYLESIRGEMTDQEVSAILDASRPPVDELKHIRKVSLQALPQKVRDRFFLCVPDAKNTEEVVSLKPVLLMFLGRLLPKKEEIMVSNHAKPYVMSQLKAKGLR